MLVLLLGSLALVVVVLHPLLDALLVAAVLASVLWPFHRWLSRTLRGRQWISGTLLVGLVVVIMVGPLVGLTTFLIREGADAVGFIATTLRSSRVEELIARLPDPVEQVVRQIVERLPSGAPSMTGKVAATIVAAASATGSFIFQTVMMLIAVFFFLTAKDSILAFIDAASPLRKGRTRELLDEMRAVARAVFASALLTALVQAVAALVGFLIARVPHPVFFAAVTFLLALIPAVGAGSVCLAAAALLLATGHPGYAIFLAIWGITVVGLSDNVVKPLLVKLFGREVELHGGVVFFSLLGGLLAFGAIGLLVGPLAVALFIACLRIYKRDFVEEEVTLEPPLGKSG